MLTERCSRIVLASLGAVVLAFALAGRILAQTATLSGTIRYNGTHGSVSASQPIRLVLFASTNFDEDPVASTSVTVNGGAYELETPSPGTYYLAYFLDLNGDGEAQGDPAEIYSNRFQQPGDPVSVPQVNVSLDFDDTLIFQETESEYHIEIQGNANGSVVFGTRSNNISPTRQLFYNGFSVIGDGGAAASGAEFLLPAAGHSPPLRTVPPTVGETWNDTDNSGGYPVQSTAVVMALDETVSVPAGTFTNCAKVREDLTYPLGIPSGQNWPTVYRRWFAPGVGPVRLQIVNNDGSKQYGELTAYSTVSASPTDYFPLAPGYSWVFTMVGTGRSVNARVDGPGGCIGDCSGDGRVTVDEVLSLVNIALGSGSFSTCPAGDGNHDEQITVDEILSAVDRALTGC